MWQGGLAIYKTRVVVLPITRCRGRGILRGSIKTGGLIKERENSDDEMKKNWNIESIDVLISWLENFGATQKMTKQSFMTA